jgi:hypothetical protein
LVALILFPILLFASTKREITVKSASTQKKVILLNAEVGRVHFQLSCLSSDSSCRIPRPGRYFAVEAKTDEAPYQDCYNINLYDRSDDGEQGPLIGTYCLLGDEATSKLIDPKK